MSVAPCLELIDIVKQFANPQGGEQPALLRGICLQLQPGESVGLMGVSGSGKSTLLNILGGLDLPTSGTVRLDGRDLTGLSDRELAGVRNRFIGFIFQAHHLLPQCSALENVLLPTLAPGNKTPPAEIRTRAEKLLNRVGLSDRMHYRPGLLSGGERQRVAVVRALINRPKLLLADEPTGALDRAAAESLTELLLQLNREEAVTLVVATHSEPLAHRMARVLELRDGLLQPPATPGAAHP